MLKLDLSKSYDRVDWDFLKSGLEAFGFNKRSTKLIHYLVSMTTFSMLVNGSPTPFFKSSRGLRQGDPLSPILFIIMAKFLGRYIGCLVQKGDFIGLQPSSKEKFFSH